MNGHEYNALPYNRNMTPFKFNIKNNTNKSNIEFLTKCNKNETYNNLMW